MHNDDEITRDYLVMTQYNLILFQALIHLEDRLIKTVDPEKIRGGGLLKYCQLLIKGFKAADPEECHLMEKYVQHL